MKNKFTVYSLLSSIVVGLLLLSFSILLIGDFVNFIEILSNASLIQGSTLATIIIVYLLSIAMSCFIIFLCAREIKNITKATNDNKKIVLKIIGIFYAIYAIIMLISNIVGHVDAGIIVLSILILLVGGFSLFLGYFKVNFNDQTKMLTNFISLGLNFIFIIVLLATTLNSGIYIAVGVFVLFVLLITITIEILRLFSNKVLVHELNVSLETSENKTQDNQNVVEENKKSEETIEPEIASDENTEVKEPEKELEEDNKE